MKIKSISGIFPLAIIGFLLIISNSCKKDETTTSSSKKTPVIIWANAADITYGTLLSATQLNATADVPGTFFYTPAAGTKLNEGANQDLKVDFTPTDASSYNTARKTVKINVNGKIDPVISWANPADISYGTLLSAAQLNAIVNVPGSFVYTPATGTKLNEGANQDLKVVFKPTDAAAYNTASKTVKINVIVTISDIIFNPNLTYGTITDVDGNVYKTITIGTQTWMAENLRTTRYRDGDTLPEVRDDTKWFNTAISAYCNYNNTSNSDSIAIFGRLYNWYAVNDSHNLAPSGWHVASDAEWTTLTDYLGGLGFVSGKLKETGTAHWHSPNEAATNESGFTALPGGVRFTNGTFDGIGYDGLWWCSTKDNIYWAWLRFIYYKYSSVSRDIGGMNDGYSVRCVRD
jgi:uncharacterized protein (TIGR02145 family)